MRKSNRWAAGQSDSNNYEAYTYDANDQLLSYRRRDGVTIGFSYDALGNVLTKSIPGQSTVYSSYDLLGRQLSLTYDSASGPGLAYTYDNAGRVKTETSYGKTISYAYDKDSNRTSLTWPDGQSVTMTANTANQFSGVSKSGVFSVGYSYDAYGRVNQIKRGTTAQSVLGFDGFDRLTSLANTFATAPSNINYGLAYTPGNQLKSLTASNASYDWPVSATNQARVADGLNRDAGIAALQGGYDLRGNLTNDGTRQYGYDTENHLISVAGPVTAGLSYDPAGRLRQTVINGVTTQFLYSGNDLIAEMDGAGAILRRYVHGPGVNNPLVWLEGPGMAASGVRYLYKDRLGSITSWTNSAGVVQATFAYGPYGEPKTWGGSRFGYTGQVALSELGLYHYHARVYDPVTGRFLQTDPTGYDDGPNLYIYVGGDPINMVDPLGMAGEQAVIDTIVVTATKKTAFAALVAAVPVIGAIAGVVQVFNFVSKIFGPKKKPKVPKENSTFHSYTVAVTTQCSAQAAFDWLKAPGMSAPGAPAAQEGFRGPITLWGNGGKNQITQLVDSQARRIVNTTLPPHQFYPGSVTFKVSPKGEGSTITVTGTGTGANPLLNDAIGYTFFGAVAQAAAALCNPSRGVPMP